MAGRLPLAGLALGLWLGMIGVAWGLTGVSAEIDPPETELGRPVLLRVRVPGQAAARIDLSGLTDFTVTPRGRVTGRSSLDGVEQTVTVHRFELAPRRAGELTLPPLTVILPEGETRTGELRLRVRQRPQPPPDLAGRDIALTATVSTDTPVAGEPFRYTLRLYRATAVATATVTPPTFPGFAVEALPGQRDSEITVAGRTYAVTEVDYRLTAARPGPAVLDPGAAVCRLQDAPGKPGSGRTFTCASAPVALTVQPRPIAPAPSAPRPAVPDPATPLPDLPPDAGADRAPPAWPEVAVLALAGPALYLALRRQGRRNGRDATQPPASPSALAEQVRDHLARQPRGACPRLRQALERLDRLLYAGQTPDAAALDRAVRETRHLLHKETAS